MTNELLLRQALQEVAGAGHLAWSVEPLHGGQSGSRVYRLRPPGGAPLILKLLIPAEVAPHLAEDYPHIGVSEFRFYTELQPVLGIPAARLVRSGLLGEGASYLALEDLSTAHRIPPEGHVWTDGEMRSVLETYAHMHAASRGLFGRDGVPGWLHADPRLTYDPEVVLGCFAQFAANDWTAEAAAPVAGAAALPALARQVAVALNGEPAALLYNDFYPLNVALPVDGGPAKLFDWQLAGLGPALVDIVNIGFLGDSPAFRQVDREGLLNFYLDRLASHGIPRPETGAFRRNYDFAVLLAWGIFLPRIVKAMQKCNREGRRFSAWMDSTFRTCMHEWHKRLEN